MKIGIGILAGGKSRRMGQDKSELIYRGKSFIENLIEEFSNYDIIISSNKDYDFKYENIEFVKDEYKDIGPISGILEILKLSEYEYNFILPVDMQNITGEYMNYLKGYISKEYLLYVVRNKGYFYPLAGIYSKKLIPILEESIKDKDYKLQNLIKRNFTKSIDFKYSKFDDDILQNINTMKEFKELNKAGIISICGCKNSGKTTFIVRLIKNLKEKGYTVSVIKHDGHDFDLKDDTDTGKYYGAGANNIAIFSNYRHMVYRDSQIHVKNLLNEFKTSDIIIIEGLKNEGFDKYEIVRESISREIISKKPLSGIITDIESLKKEYTDSFHIDEVEKFANFLIERYINP